VCRDDGDTGARREYRAACGPWYRELTTDQWKAFLATFFAWTLDGFDFTILSFLIADIQQSFTVSKALTSPIPPMPSSERTSYGPMRLPAVSDTSR
jgi:hypothetical protein